MERPRVSPLVTLVSLAMLMLPAAHDLRAQWSGAEGPVEWSRTVASPYAGKYEARIGGSRESEHEKLRLDIGASVDVLGYHTHQAPAEGENDRDLQLPNVFTSYGADFFTWTRLRAAGGFKFPVEAVDYYFGINGARHYNEGVLSDVRLRLAHISAHLVDGDPSFTDPEQQYITYSREFVDAMIGFNGNAIRGASKDDPISFRPYAGALWLFHTIPDTLGVITPYAGFDGSWRLAEGSLPVTLKLGYEARLNMELEPIGEHLLRLGVKLGRPRSNGVTIEGSYYSGRSPYGQHFWNRERFFSLGFAVEM